MPLLSPNQIHEVLKESGVKKTTPGDKGELSVMLDDANLSPAEVLQNLGSLMRMGETDAVKLKAAETALKLSGYLNNNDDGKGVPHFTIIINDSEIAGINPILIPR